MDLLVIFLGQIPEAIFFSLFMIFVKSLKEKRLLFTALMIFEYLFLIYFLKFNIWFQVLYTFMTFVILKMLYKEKAHIIDIFTFTIGSLIMGIIDWITYFVVWKTVNNYTVYVVLVRIIQILFFIVLHNKLHKIQNIYKKFWNRNRDNPNKIKSTTFRSLNVVVFNIMFYLINVSMIFTLFQRGGV